MATSSANPNPDERTGVDPVTAEIIRHGLDAAADQMLVALRRTAFSPIIYDVLDGAGALYDRQFRMLTQIQTLPLFTGSLGLCVEAVTERWADGGLAPGDVIVVNDPFLTGTHQWDVAVIVPGFWNGTLVAYAAIKAHHLDVAAVAPFVSDTTDVFQEGTIYPGVKLYAAGERNEDMYRTFLANTRLPTAAAGDLSAQAGACRTGLAALIELIDRYGLERFDAATELIFDYGEAKMREQLAVFPSGRYVTRGLQEHNGLEEINISYDVVIELDDGDVTVDLTDAPPAQRGPVNTPYIGVVSAVRCALMALSGGEHRANEGFFRPLTIKTRPGSMFHALPPSPCALASYPLYVLNDRIHAAFAQADPLRLPAGFDQAVSLVMYGFDAAGNYWADSVNGVGGSPAAAAYGDGGGPLMPVACSGVRLCSFEVWEAKTPMLVERCEYVPDAAGAGRYCGGPAIDMVITALLDMDITIVNERAQTPPTGLAGGGSGRPSRVYLHTPAGTVGYAKVTGAHMPKGSSVEVNFSGGGGFGNPAARPAEAVQRDLAEGLLTLDGAERDYPHAFAAAPPS